MAYQHILLIDDDDDDQEIFRTAIEQLGYADNFTGLYSAKDALQALEERKVNPDVIFLDLNMPVMNGQEFLVHVKNNDHLKDIPVIILSTSSHPSAISVTKTLGAKDFFSKPGKFEDMITLLQKALA